MPPTDLQALEPVSAGLLATPPAPLPFGPDLLARAFLLQRAEGNLLVYNAPGLASAADEIARLGGAVRQVVNHGHEAMFGPQGIDVPLFVHERDEREVARSMPVSGTFAGRQTIGDDFEIVPTPGHTPGTTAFRWDNGEHRFLFTGDMLTVEHGRWCAILLGSSDRDTYLESLASLRKLDFDVLVPWAALSGEPFVEFTGAQEAHEQIDAVIARVRAGADR